MKISRHKVRRGCAYFITESEKKFWKGGGGVVEEVDDLAVEQPESVEKNTGGWTPTWRASFIETVAVAKDFQVILKTTQKLLNGNRNAAASSLFSPNTWKKKSPAIQNCNQNIEPTFLEWPSNSWARIFEPLTCRLILAPPQGPPARRYATSLII